MLCFHQVWLFHGRKSHKTCHLVVWFSIAPWFLLDQIHATACMGLAWNPLKIGALIWLRLVTLPTLPLKWLYLAFAVLDVIIKVTGPGWLWRERKRTNTHILTHPLTTCFPIWHLELISKPCQAKCREIKRDITTTMCSVRYDDPNGKSSYLSYHHTLIHVNVRKNALRNISK